MGNDPMQPNVVQSTVGVVVGMRLAADFRQHGNGPDLCYVPM